MFMELAYRLIWTIDTAVRRKKMTKELTAPKANAARNTPTYSPAIPRSNQNSRWASPMMIVAKKRLSGRGANRA